MGGFDRLNLTMGYFMGGFDTPPRLGNLTRSKLILFSALIYKSVKTYFILQNPQNNSHSEAID